MTFLQRNSRLERWATHLILIGLTMNPLTSSISAGAAEPFEITREVLLESGHFPIPSALIQTKEGGYIVAGTELHRPWATRIDAQGAVQWRHVLPMKNWEPGDGDAEYQGAAIMVKDTALLCGYKHLDDKSNSHIVGMLTRIDKTGQVVSHRQLYPQGDQSFSLNYLRKCMPWGDGFAVIGQASRWVGSSKPHRQERFIWILALDTNGEVKWEKLLPEMGSLGALVLLNQDLVLSQSYDGGTQIDQIDATGAIKAQRTIPIGAMLVRPVGAEQVLRLASGISGTTLWTLGEQLEDVGRVAGKAEMVYSETAYLLPDHSLILFGRQREGSEYTASVTRFDSDLNKKQTFLLQPLWVSPWISGALPTGRSGEFATIREIHPIKQWPDEKRSGLVLAFIRVK